MPILSHYNSYYWTSMPILSQSEKLLYVLSHPAGLLSRKNDDFWNFGTYPFSKSVYFLILNNFSKNGSPGQTTMLMRRAAKFCVEPRSPFFYISHHDPKTLGKPLIIVSWPECRPESPSDGDGGGVQRTLAIWRDPSPPRTGSKYPVQGIPHFDFVCLYITPSPSMQAPRSRYGSIAIPLSGTRNSASSGSFVCVYLHVGIRGGVGLAWRFTTIGPPKGIEVRNLI